MKLTYIVILLIIGTTLLSASNLRVEVKELSKNSSKYKILDVRNGQLFLKGHIKGAISFHVNLSYDNLKLDGKITPPNKMQDIIQKHGLNIDDKILIYDDGSFFDATRLFWTLEVYGFKNLRVLNGGYPQYIKSKLPISKQTLAIKPSNYIASVDNKRLATKFTTQIATRNPNQLIIDARQHRSYIGDNSSAKRFGHIPKAINIPATKNIEKDGNLSKLKTTKELKQLYKNVDKSKKIVLYCAMGKTATTNYFALRELGYDVSNYDSSWKEWGNDYNLPVINRAKEK